ncbi:unnamed protein product [Moneuplotes crassus]|uniref:Uncharacterized protein n=1 Tax=Euplotes crassus TaxID=5936 RepID=A0AAD1UNY2_EUPCR|nr:unnamed protein product [Moneuplotes crassus]
MGQCFSSSKGNTRRKQKAKLKIDKNLKSSMNSSFPSEDIIKNSPGEPERGMKRQRSGCHDKGGMQQPFGSSPLENKAQAEYSIDISRSYSERSKANIISDFSEPDYGEPKEMEKRTFLNPLEAFIRNEVVVEMFHTLKDESNEGRENWERYDTGKLNIEVSITPCRNIDKNDLPISKVCWRPGININLGTLREAMGKFRKDWDSKIQSNRERRLTDSEVMLINTKLKDIRPQLQKLKEKYKDLIIPDLKPKQFFDQRICFEIDNKQDNSPACMYIFTQNIDENDYKTYCNEEFEKQRDYSDNEDNYETGKTLLNIQRITYDKSTERVRDLTIFNQVDTDLDQNQLEMAMNGLPKHLVNWIEALEDYLIKQRPITSS